jgi:hypothetical protein
MADIMDHGVASDKHVRMVLSGNLGELGVNRA